MLICHHGRVKIKITCGVTIITVQYASTRFGLRSTTRRMDSQGIFQMSNTIVTLRLLKYWSFAHTLLFMGSQYAIIAHLYTPLILS